MSRSAFVLLIAGIVSPGVRSARFSTTSPEDGAFLNVCAGNMLVLPWEILLTKGDTLEDIKWYFTDHTNIKEMIAISANSLFLPVPAYSERLHVVNASCLELSHVTTEDAGNYSLEVVTHDSSGQAMTIHRSLHVQVGGGLQTTDGELHVTYTPTAVQDNTGRWSVQLKCGNFTYLDAPSFGVQWMFPSGRTEYGLDYRNGQFMLYLSAPVEGGNYTCRIPQESLQEACLHGNDQDSAEARLDLDGTEVRLMLLEAHQAALQRQNAALKAENSQLKANLTLVEVETSQLRRNFTEQNAALTQLRNALVKTERHVSFQAVGLHKVRFSLAEILIPYRILTNEGNAYDNDTGYFTAPYNGTYFFAATGGSWVTKETATFALVVDVAEVLAYGQTTDPDLGETMSIQTVVHLTRGQKVWLKSQSSATYPADMTSFSGFLLHSD